MMSVFVACGLSWLFFEFLAHGKQRPAEPTQATPYRLARAPVWHLVCLHASRTLETKKRGLQEAWRYRRATKDLLHTSARLSGAFAQVAAILQ